MPFDWKKWAEEGADPKKLQDAERATLKQAWGSESDSVGDLRKSLFDTDPTKHSSESGGLTLDDVKSIVQKEQDRSLFEAQLTAVRKDLGEEAYSRHFDSARRYMEKGLSPSDAFNIVRQPELTAAAIEAAKTEALKQARLEARRSESNYRQRNGFVPPEASLDNQWVADKNKYQEQRKSLLRLSSEEETAWRRANPDFSQAEQAHGDVNAIAR